MRQSKIFTKTKKDISKDEVSINAILLSKAGFIDKTMAGVYSFLPLGLKVLNKINEIIREEMNAIGAQEILMPALSPKKLWEQTGRLEMVDVLFEARGANEFSQKKNSVSYVLNSTHEEVVTPLVQKYCLSYKDLPFSVYQIQSKFRNEARAKSGILRGREFFMKDLYSFHANQADLEKFYEKSKTAYMNVFKRVGLGDSTVIALASGGDFTKDYTHEFQTKCEAGEDDIFYDKKNDIYYNKEVTPSKASLLKNQETEAEKNREDVLGKGIIGVEELAEFLRIPVEKTTKTLLYEIDEEKIIAVAIRGDYDINEEKLLKVVGCKSLKLASEEKVKKVTGAEIGYAGLLNLPADIDVYMDESVDARVNFEMGINKTDYHAININFGRDLEKPEKFFDFKVARAGDINPETGEAYEIFKASEVGNIFKLNTKFSKSFNYYYVNEDGKQEIVYMGCYGIGPSRLMGVVVEKYHDEKGMIWPEEIAPYKVHLVRIESKEQAVEDAADKLYEELNSAGVEVLYDDRSLRAGEKFADADLIGCPYRIVISEKTLKEDCVEFKKRDSENIEMIKIENILDKIVNRK
jgi:prolyl-tRNA synthetase